MVRQVVRLGTTLLVFLAVPHPAVAGPIHDAVRKGKQARVVALLSEKPDLISSRDNLGDTPLLLAAKYNQFEIAQLLLANGADVNAKNVHPGHAVVSSGETPLTYALASYNNTKMVELLLTHGADVNVNLGDGTTPLIRAVQRNLPEDVKLLTANGANLNAQAHWGGNTCLHIAVLADNRAMVKLLLDAGEDPNAGDLSGHTPLWYAEHPPSSDPRYGGRVYVGDPAIVAMLRAHGAHD